MFVGRCGSFWVAFPLLVLHHLMALAVVCLFQFVRAFCLLRNLLFCLSCALPIKLLCCSFLMRIEGQSRQGAGALSVAFGEGTESEAKFSLPPQLSLYHDSR